MSHIPALPAELQRDIFELAVRSIRGSGRQLVTVARRVHIWYAYYFVICKHAASAHPSSARIEPVVYEMVTLDQPQINAFLRTVNSKPAAFFAKHVKTLCLTENIEKEDALRVLSVCTGIVNLAVWTDFGQCADTLSVIANLRLRRFAIPLQTLIGRTLEVVNLTAFRELTHLDINDFQHCWMDVTFDLPHLTHLALNFSLHASVAIALRNILLKIKSLQIVVLSLDTDHWEMSQYAHSHLKRHGLDDPRVVALSYAEFSLKEWEGFERAEVDRWARAEAIVMSRSCTWGKSLPV